MTETGARVVPSSGYVAVSRRDLRALVRAFTNSTLAHAAAGHELEFAGRRGVACAEVFGSAFE